MFWYKVECLTRIALWTKKLFFDQKCDLLQIIFWPKVRFFANFRKNTPKNTTKTEKMPRLLHFFDIFFVAVRESLLYWIFHQKVDFWPKKLIFDQKIDFWPKNWFFLTENLNFDSNIWPITSPFEYFFKFIFWHKIEFLTETKCRNFKLTATLICKKHDCWPKIAFLNAKDWIFDRIFSNIFLLEYRGRFDPRSFEHR